MSCCDNQSQADKGPTLPPFLQFSKRFMQFDLNRPRDSVRMLDETGEEASSQPNNILCVPAVLWGFHKMIRGPGPQRVRGSAPQRIRGLGSQALAPVANCSCCWQPDVIHETATLSVTKP